MLSLLRHPRPPAAGLFLLGLLLLACSAPPTVTAIPRPAEGHQVIVAEVIDGDTVQLNDGRTVRYIGINCPELGQPLYQEARTANRRLVQGKTVWLVLGTRSLDRYGRLLAYVWAGDRLVNLELVRQGFANVYTEPPNVRYSAELLQAERDARRAQVGLWALADVPVRIRTIHYDAPGPDDQNPNGEWVELANEGAQTVDMTGFTLKDEANHLYSFPRLRLKPRQVLRVYSGQGEDSSSALYWGLSNDAVWDNDGDTAYLRDPDGRLVDRYNYAPP